MYTNIHTCVINGFLSACSWIKNIILHSFIAFQMQVQLYLVPFNFSKI